MIVQHNIMAINSHRQLGINNTNLSKNLEKLSSGYRINKAADDAAGLAISEKMRAQITGIDRAILNAQDGASLIQTAEGALTEVHSMLNRMVELATQSANGTIQDSDRDKIESELTALKDEIDRISKATNFNGINLLDGSLSTGAAANVKQGTATEFDAIQISGFIDSTTGKDTVSYNQSTKGESKITMPAFKAGTGVTDSLVKGNTYTMDITLSDGTVKSIKLEAKEMTVGEKDIKGTAATAGQIGLYYNGELVMNSGASTGAAANTVLGDAFQYALEQDEEFSAAYDIEWATNNTSVTIKNKENGSIASGQNSIANVSFTTVNTATNEVKNVTGDTTLYKAEVKEGLDATKGVSIKNIMDQAGTDGYAEFSVNGETFVVFQRGNEADAKEAFKDRDDVTFVGMETFGTAGDRITEEDMQRLADAINEKTGLMVEVTLSVTNKAPTAGDKFSDGTAAGVGAANIGLLFRTVDPDSGKAVDGAAGKGLTMQVGDTADDFNKITVSVDDMSSKGLGIDKISMATQEAAAASIDKVKAAIEKVSVNRGNLGALQNRLEYTINNQGATSENMTAAESRIRDVDMAKEMMQFTKNNVLSQAAQAMLAQANMQPQQVLQLLR